MDILIVVLSLACVAALTMLAADLRRQRDDARAHVKLFRDRAINPTDTPVLIDVYVAEWRDDRHRTAELQRSNGDLWAGAISQWNGQGARWDAHAGPCESWDSATAIYAERPTFGFGVALNDDRGVRLIARVRQEGWDFSSDWRLKDGRLQLVAIVAIPPMLVIGGPCQLP